MEQSESATQKREALLRPYSASLQWPCSPQVADSQASLEAEILHTATCCAAREAKQCSAKAAHEASQAWRHAKAASSAAAVARTQAGAAARAADTAESLAAAGQNAAIPAVVGEAATAAMVRPTLADQS